jgi:predicted O-methyltransferase YrrM
MITTRIKTLINTLLEPVNLKIETLTEAKREIQRLKTLAEGGHFSQPIAPVPESFRSCEGSWIFEAIGRHSKDFSKVAMGGGCTPYQLANDYYTSPDAEVLYSLTRLLKPKKIIEVGSGNSTLLFREAIQHEGSATELISIDPHPRRDIRKFADRFLQTRLEGQEAKEELLLMEAGDFLFIDSSHEVKTGNDVVKLFLQILPILPSGVVIHVHDIFLPYEYPEQWIIHETRKWAEQYFVQVLLQESKTYEVLWPGHYFQKTQPLFNTFFPQGKGNSAQSLWIRKL